MRLRPTKELVEIWTKNNRAEWTETTFEVIRDILSERLETIPDQEPPSHQRTDLWNEDMKNFLHSTWFLTDGLGLLFLLITLLGAWIISLVFGGNAPFLYYNILLILTVPIAIVSSVFSLRLRAKADSLNMKMKGFSRTVSGIFGIIFFGIGEVILLLLLIFTLFRS